MKYTLIFIFNKNMSKVLMVHKNRGPFPGKLNGIGGKIENDESPYDGAFREMLEETGLKDCFLYPIVCEVFTSGTNLYVYYTKINDINEVKQIEDEKLEWFDVEELLKIPDIFLAGEGNIKYFINYAINIECKKRINNEY